MASMMLKRLTTLVTAVALFLSACTRHEGFLWPEQNEPLYTIAEAEKAYELARMGLSRSEATAGVLTLGAYQPDWSGAEISIDSTLYSADVPIEGEYAYYRYLEIEGEVFWIPLYPKLVTVTTPEKDLSSVYIRYYVPHEYYEWSHDPEVYDELLNSLPKGDFTGLSLYTTLSGDPVCVARYDRGYLKEYAFLFDSEHTTEERVAMMNTILNGLKVGRVSRNPISRANGEIDSEDPPQDGGEIKEVVIVGVKPQQPEDQNDEPDKDEQVHLLPIIRGDSNNEKPGMGGGNGGNSSSDNGDQQQGSEKSKYNDKITYEDAEIVEPLLDSIAKDCMGGTLLDGLGDVTIVTNSDRNSYNSETNTIYLKNDPAYGFRDYVFLEELIHAYQFQNQDYVNDRLLDNEIEAKVGWLLYKERRTEGLTNELLNRAFGKPQAQNAVFSLADSFYYGIPPTTNFFIENYYIFAVSLHLLPAYENYSFLGNESSRRFETLVMLMINCPTL